jgi:hypothetical protein
MSQFSAFCNIYAVDVDTAVPFEWWSRLNEEWFPFDLKGFQRSSSSDDVFGGKI